MQIYQSRNAVNQQMVARSLQAASLSPSEASTGQLMAAGGGGLVGAIAGWKLGSKRGAGKKWAALGALGGVVLGFVGAHAAGA